MKKYICFLAAALALLSCTHTIDNPYEDNEPVSSDPELTVSGLPGSRVISDAIFILTVQSKSSGFIDFKSSNPDAAFISLYAKRQYKVAVTEVTKDTPITITFTQEAKGDYDAASLELNFTIASDSHGTYTISDEPLPDIDGEKVTFTESLKPLTNPERGMYRSKNFDGNSVALKTTEVQAQRALGYSLFYMGFYLSDFMDGDISQAYLDMFQESMDALREGGIKCMLRFAYRSVMSDKIDMEPEVKIVHRHVEQLKPYLQKNADVIFVLQAGFIGPWGEWHSSTHFGSNYQLRREFIDALLDALPQSRQIQLRTPQFKMRMFGLTAKDTITAATAHDGSPVSRIAGHNDCFGASVNDYGTFDNEKNDREFWKADTRYTIMGGETCNVSDYCKCKATVQDLVDYHWTCLNYDYNSDVINRWKTSSCYEDIVARLGYRLVMADVHYSKEVKAGKPCSVTLRFYNTGYAAPMNPREAILVWETPSGVREETALGSDPRTWHTGYHCVTASFTPSTDKGTLYLKLSDPLLSDRPEYSISLANEGVFDANTGLNILFDIK